MQGACGIKSIGLSFNVSQRCFIWVLVEGGARVRTSRDVLYGDVRGTSVSLGSRLGSRSKWSPCPWLRVGASGTGRVSQGWTDGV